MLNFGRLAQEMLRIIYCSSEARFQEIFGEADGSKLWDLFRNRYSGNQGRILVEMNSSQAEKLAQYAMKSSPDLSPTPVDATHLGNVIGFGSDD
jgi:hypothetical protein